MSYMEIPAEHTPDNTARIPTNCYWLQTAYWCFVWDFYDINFRGIGSPPLEIPAINSPIFLQVHRASETCANFQLHRKKVPGATSDDGFVLHFIVSIVGFQPKRIHAYMKNKDSYVSVYFEIDPDKLTDIKGNNFTWVVKCYCEMCEISDLGNETFKMQNELVVKDFREDPRRRRKLACMAAMMRRQNLDNLLSGRQTYGFAFDKASIIDRTIEYADDILYVLSQGGGKGMNDKHKRVPQILGYIYEENILSIDDVGLVDLFSMAYRYGLWYLQLLCRVCMKEKVLGINDIVNGLVLCDVFCHESGLTDWLVDEYFKRDSEIRMHKKWKSLANYLKDTITDTLLRTRREGTPCNADKDTQEMNEMVKQFEESLVLYNKSQES